jgi:hypothetical protein
LLIGKTTNKIDTILAALEKEYEGKKNHQHLSRHFLLVFHLTVFFVLKRKLKRKLEQQPVHL